ncbi:nuclear transport factor 2 family protein [Fulvivirga ulvae]|uniref:nuclear transport factor 2 family protein n=1 Tax=Fulvivirga ulvae TaxID=2904245 RepID=UPI001F46539C|nr:nuclear transport factor 2 family protein [Fulvivirga ulvae]UII32557.1 nuclear transport factor 2 family protein [Fulvivirga ulvae]
MKSILILIVVLTAATLTYGQTPEELADLQLDGYNNRDIETFLSAYSDSVKVYNFPATLLYTGKENMQKRYSDMFDKMPDLHCELVNRIVEGHTVIDHENVIFDKSKPAMRAIAIYKVSEGKIQEVYFIVDQSK